MSTDPDRIIERADSLYDQLNEKLKKALDVIRSNQQYGIESEFTGGADDTQRKMNEYLALIREVELAGLQKDFTPPPMWGRVDWRELFSRNWKESRRETIRKPWRVR